MGAGNLRILPFMKLLMEKAIRPVQLQWLMWALAFIINYVSYLPMDGWGQSGVYAVINTGFYAAIIYGNIHLLLPRLYERGRVVLYVLVSLVGLVVLALGRGYLSLYLYNRFFAEKPMGFTLRTFVYVMTASILVYILSFVFRLAIAYFRLKKQADEVIAQKSMAELNLLKSQVQPHFLFNTLNNIYYEAYRESPRTAMFIERLSDIMRYFVDESPKEEVTLATEIRFLENYIALEKVRIRHGVVITFIKDCNLEAVIPPMLLMTFVENIFKHGIDKSNRHNLVKLSLVQENGFLLFRTENRLYPVSAAGNGFGVRNLRSRLSLLYGNNFDLQVYPDGDTFNAYLKIPLP